HVNEPGREEWDGWRAATRGAAAGGVTTLADMPLNSVPPTLDAAAAQAKDYRAARAAIVDYALWGGLVGPDRAPLRDLKTAGVVGLKAFLCPSGAPEFPHLDAGTLHDALAAATAAGHLVAVHAEDEALVAKGADQLLAMNRRDRAAWLASRPPAAERRASGCGSTSSPATSISSPPTTRRAPRISRRVATPTSGRPGAV